MLIFRWLIIWLVLSFPTRAPEWVNYHIDYVPDPEHGDQKHHLTITAYPEMHVVGNSIYFDPWIDHRYEHPLHDSRVTVCDLLTECFGKTWSVSSIQHVESRMGGRAVGATAISGVVAHHCAAVDRSYSFTIWVSDDMVLLGWHLVDPSWEEITGRIAGYGFDDRIVWGKHSDYPHNVPWWWYLHHSF